MIDQAQGTREIRSLRRARIAPCCAVLSLAALMLLSAAQPALAQTDGERAWQKGQAAALRGAADEALTSYREAIRLSKQDEDTELASAARLGMAEVFDVWKRCRDSARAAYRDAVEMTSEGDYAAADSYVLWLARQGDQAGARQLHARTYAPIENDVPRTITRESINFLLGLAAIQIANSSRSGALYSLTAARDIAARLASGGEEEGERSATSSRGTVRQNNYWVIQDMAALYLDPASRDLRNLSLGRSLQREADAATSVSDDGGHPRFTVGRLADRIARARRTCASAACRVPPLPPRPRCP